MSSIGMFEAKTHLSALTRRVANGGEIVVTDRGRPVMKLVPIEAKPAADPLAHARRIEALRQQAVAWRKARGQEPVLLEEALSWRDEGRR